uniref:BED-type domain-containing protein n=1 Tax=Populus trichocarpa TaxID=3694 RepID=A0A3N7ES23_POPTR
METKEVEAIQNILNDVCEIHELPLALIWIKHRDFDDLYIRAVASYISSMQEYVLACLRNPLKKGQNVAGKAVNLMHQYTVPDVSSLDLADYPFVDLAVKLGLRAALAVRLKCMSVGEIEYVAEVFLRENLKDSVEQNNLINGIISSLCTKCEEPGTLELQIQADPKLNLSEEVEASQIPSVAFSKSSFSVFTNVGLNIKEKIQNNRVETDEPHEQEVRGKNATVELDVDGNKLVGETHDTQQSKRINKRKKNDTQQTKHTRKTRKTTSIVWDFFTKVEKEGVVYAKCPDCKKELPANSRNGTTSLHRHGCCKVWKKDEKQQSDSNVESSAKANPKNKASQNIGAGAPPQAKRRKLVANVGEEREEEETSSASTNAIVMAEEQYPIVSGIGQAAVSGLAHDQVQELTVQEDYTAKETPGRGLKDQEHHLVSGSIIESLPTETQSSGLQATNTAIDGTGGVPQVERTNMELTAEDGNLDSSTTSIATTPGFPVISAASEFRSLLSQSPRVLLSPAENDRFCSLLNAEIIAASNECEKHTFRELLARVHRLKEAIASCPFSSRPETVPLQGDENLDSEISQSAILRSNLEAEITLLKDQAAQLEEQLKAINEQRTQKELELSTLEKDDAVIQARALQRCQATTQRLNIDNIVAGITDLFDYAKSVLPKP